MRNINIAILLFLSSTIINAQDSINCQPYLYGSAGSIRVILGVGDVFGFRYGASIFITDKWSFELGHGSEGSIDLGGGNYSINYTGVAVNRFFPVNKTVSIIASVLYSYANVTERTYEYPDDFKIISPMVGVDFSHQSGISTFTRVGIKFTPGNDRKSETIAFDVGICWRFNIFCAP
ncbi:MAG: hypothetical protein WAV76_15245 [Bacteroidota bacterium]